MDNLVRLIYGQPTNQLRQDRFPEVLAGLRVVLVDALTPGVDLSGIEWVAVSWSVRVVVHE
jgi:hypothetical protein